MILLINKNNLFNEEMLKDYKFIKYVNYEEKELLVEEETLKHFENLKAYLKVNGIIIDIDSAYRSLEYQENLFLDFVNKYGMEYAEKYVAMPGTSEHHTGQAIDFVVCKGDKWLTENCSLEKEEETLKIIFKVLKHFGFILRYPKEKEEITGIPYEPWHIRYIGEEDSLKIRDLTLEEYLNKK